MQLTRAGRRFGSFRRQPAPRTLRSAQPPLGFPARPPRRGSAHSRRGDVRRVPRRAGRPARPFAGRRNTFGNKIRTNRPKTAVLDMTGCDEVCSAQFPFSFTETPSPNPAGFQQTETLRAGPLAAAITPLQMKVPSKGRRQTQLSPVLGWREGKSGGLAPPALGATLPAPQIPQRAGAADLVLPARVPRPEA